MTGVVVTGPPRSGTSATARLLHLAGLSLCVPADRVGGGPNNPRGHWESRTVLAVDNRLLADAGTRWWCPPQAPIDDGVDVADAAAFRSVHPHQPWLCKDPRFCVTLPAWRRALGDVRAAVVVVRHPAEVVASIRRTWPLTIEHAAALWCRYLVVAASATTGLEQVVAVRFPQLLHAVDEAIGALGGSLASAGVTLRTPPPDAVAEYVDRPRGADVPVALPTWTLRWWIDLGADDVIGPLATPPEPSEVERILGARRAELHAGRPIDTRPVFATEAIG